MFAYYVTGFLSKANLVCIFLPRYNIYQAFDLRRAINQDRFKVN